MYSLNHRIFQAFYQNTLLTQIYHIFHVNVTSVKQIIFDLQAQKYPHFARRPKLHIV